MQPKSGYRFALSLIALAASYAALPASAHVAPLGDDGEVRYNFTANYGLAARLDAPSAALTDPSINPAVVNANDGDLNFKKGGLINNRISLLGEVDARYNANQGVFLRAQAFYDAAYHGQTANTAMPLSFTDNHAPGMAQFAPGTRRASGAQAEVLDAYWYGDFKTGDDSAINLKVGRHVVQWGEGLFFANIAGAQSPVDVNKLNVPGAQVKDFLLPVGQISANYTLNKHWTLMGYTQLEYRETKLPAAGSFWSVVDFLGPGAENMFLGAPPSATNPFGLSPRGNDIKPSARGQWGLGARYITDDSTEYGFYHLHYHSRAPSLQVNYGPGFVPASYQIRYQDDIKLTGASFSTRAGDVAVAGELSYKQNVPLSVLVPSMGGFAPTNYLPAGSGMGDARGNVWQAQVNSTYIMEPNALASGGITLLGELAHQHTGSKNTPLDLAGSKDSTAIALLAIPSYPNVFDGWDLKVPISYMQFLSGGSSSNCNFSCHATFPNGDSLTLLGDKEKRFSIGAQFTYLSNLQIGLSYNKFLGTPDYVHNPLGDRDNIALNVTYNF